MIDQYWIPSVSEINSCPMFSAIPTKKGSLEERRPSKANVRFRILRTLYVRLSILKRTSVCLRILRRTHVSLRILRRTYICLRFMRCKGDQFIFLTYISANQLPNTNRWSHIVLLHSVSHKTAAKSSWGISNKLTSWSGV